MSSITISAKIPKQLKEKIAKYGIRISDLVRKTLEEEVAKAEAADLKKRLDDLSSRLKNRLTEKDIVEAIRATREEN